MKRITENWAIIAPVMALVISEILPFVKNKKANGILHLIAELLKKKKE